MKIQTHNRNQFGKKRMFGSFGKVVQFNQDGLADVPDEMGKYILANNEMITKEGEYPTVKKENPTLDNTGGLEELKAKIEKVTDKLVKSEINLKNAKKDNGILEEDLKAYKALVDDKQKEINRLNDLVESMASKKEDKAEKKEVKKDQPEFEEGSVGYQLNEKTKKELIAVCEQMEYPKEEWESLKPNNVKKIELVKYILSKSEDEQE